MGMDWRAAAQRRLNLERSLRDCAGLLNPQFDPSMIDELTMHTIMFEQTPWDQADELWAELKTARDDREAIEKAIAVSKRLLLRNSPDLKLMLEIVHKQIVGSEKFWGRGETRGYIWSHPARVMGACAFKALQSADKAAGTASERRRTDGRNSGICG
jgi:hypothetical protein